MKQGPVNKNPKERRKHQVARPTLSGSPWTKAWHSTTKPVNKDLVTSYSHNEFKYDITRDNFTRSTCSWHYRWGGLRNVHKVQGAWQSCVAASVGCIHYIILGPPHVLPCHTSKLLEHIRVIYDLKQGTWHTNYKFSSALVQSEEWCN